MYYDEIRVYYCLVFYFEKYKRNTVKYGEIRGCIEYIPNLYRKRTLTPPMMG